MSFCGILLPRPTALVKSEVVSPPSQNRVQSRNHFEPGCSPSSKEDFVQLISESLKAFGMNSGCPSSANYKLPFIRTMILILSDTPILKHSDSSFDADDWASVGVPRTLLLLRFLPS